ncbi:hypothetical protein [Streptomyces sp. 900105245]
MAELKIVGFDDDLAGEAMRINTRLRDPLKRILRPPVRPAVRKLLDQFGSTAQISKAGQHRLFPLIRPKAPRAEYLVEDMSTLLAEQDGRPGHGSGRADFSAIGIFRVPLFNRMPALGISVTI